MTLSIAGDIYSILVHGPTAVMTPRPIRLRCHRAAPREPRLGSEMLMHELTQYPENLVVAVSADDHILGPAEAPVTLVEYGDYECPDCLNALPIIKKLREQFKDQL